MAYITITVALLMKFSCLLSHTFILLVVIVHSLSWVWLFATPSGSQNIGASASALVLPNTQGWFPLGCTGWISLQSKRLSRVFSSTTVWKHQFFSIHPSLWSRSHSRTWLLIYSSKWTVKPSFLILQIIRFWLKQYKMYVLIWTYWYFKVSNSGTDVFSLIHIFLCVLWHNFTILIQVLCFSSIYSRVFCKLQPLW